MRGPVTSPAPSPRGRTWEHREFYAAVKLRQRRDPAEESEEREREIALVRSSLQLATSYDKTLKFVVAYRAEPERSAGTIRADVETHHGAAHFQQ